MVGLNRREQPRQGRITKWCRLIIFCLVCVYSFCIAVNNAIAAKDSAAIQANPKAAVVLDGRELFKIGRSGNLTATERANKVSYLLQTKLKQYSDREPPPVTIEKSSNWTVIRVSDRHLVTVIDNDIIPGMTVAEQARIWQEQVESALQKGIKERSSGYLTWALKMVAIALTIGLVIQFVLFCLNRYYRRKQLDPSVQRASSLAILGIFLLQAVIWLAFVYYCTNLFPLTRDWQYKVFKLLDNTFNSEIINLGGESSISLSHLLFLILVGIGLWFFVRWFSQLLKSQILPLTGFDDTLQSSIVFVTRYGLLFLGLLLILNSGGIDFRSLTIVLSALGVGIGFGLQNIAKDFISGVIITLTQPIKIGELVEVGEYKGLVMRIGARTTEISHVDRHLITIPNSRFIEEAVKNWNRSGLTRVKVYIDVAYNSDRDLVYKALLAAAQVYHPEILKHPPPKVKFRDFRDHSLLFRVVVFIKDPLKEPKVRNHLQKHIDANLRKYGIEIPFPQRDINLKIPQIEKLIANLAEIYQPNKPKLYYPQDKLLNKPDINSPLEELKIKDEYDWEVLIEAMRGENGIEIKDRRYGFKVYRKAFLGSEAVNWLIQQEKATRAEAIAIGQLMIEQNLIHHVLDEHNFKDEPLFYRFYIDEQDDEQDNEQDWE